ncbi:FkbM family methyltransferase [Roseicyclus sp.]|uniref:FkbM family methyltransferase n=1 Tax=Roseicyclus sp. TaxID=1914329 RepID=UPI003F6BC350
MSDRPVYAFHLKGIDLALPQGLATPDIVQKLRDGTYEEDEANAAFRTVRDGFRVLELGAGLGYVTSICAKQTAPENVMSVEANPALLPVIVDNLARNGVSGVNLIHAAVTGAAASGEMGDFKLSDGFTGSSLDGKGRPVSVPMISVYELIQSHKPHVVLMDVEGAEAAMFERPWKCPLRFCVLELHPRKYPPKVIKRIVDHMSQMGLTYDPITSRGKILGFRKVWESEVSDADAEQAP